MMILEDIVNRAIIIDNTKAEIEKLQEALEERGIWTKWYNPTIENIEIKNAFDLIFLDLWIVDSDASLEGQISKIRQLFKKSIKPEINPYGIVLWTKHEEDIEKFKEKISEDGKYYELPMFIINLDKTKYLGMNNYDLLIEDLNESLKKNPTADFFIKWNMLVQKGKNESIKNIYSLVEGYDEKKEEDLKHILQKVAQTYSGIPDEDLKNCDLEQEAKKAFCEFLNYEILNIPDDSTSKIFEPCASSLNDEEKKKIYGKINKVLLLSSDNINQSIVMPGNIYEIKKEDSIFKIGNVDASHEEKYILMEITPPCDYANGKNKTGRRRVIGGAILKKEANGKSPYVREHFATEYPIILEKDEPNVIAFDFMYFGTVEESELKDKEKYELIYRAKTRYFADILHKMAANISRVGNTIIKK